MILLPFYEIPYGDKLAKNGKSQHCGWNNRVIGKFQTKVQTFRSKVEGKMGL